MTAANLKGVPRTLLVSLACRTGESARADALLCDPRAAELFRKLGGSPDYLLKMSKLDQTFTVMRARQFDRYARAFLARHPGGLVVDIGCGLDTRFDRLDDGQMVWLGLDLPEVAELRRQVLPDGERSKTIPQSFLEVAWLESVARMNRPVIFLAEGVFPYFTGGDVEPVVRALADRFPGGELVFDALSSFSVWIHNRLHPVLQETGLHLGWGVDDPHALEAWGMCLLDKWGYFDEDQPRLGAANLMRFIAPFANSNFILHYHLGYREPGRKE